MPINHDKKFLFIHIPRNGGGSIQRMIGLDGTPVTNFKERVRKLYGREKNKNQQMTIYTYGEFSYQHLTIEELIYNKFVDYDILSDYYVFSNIRNPYDRFISIWFGRTSGKNLVDFCRKILKEKNNNKYTDQWHIPQYRFVYVMNELITDYLIRYETYEEDVRYILKKTNFNIDKFIHWGKTEKKKKHFMNYYDKESIKLVNEIYKKDFELFNYEMEK